MLCIFAIILQSVPTAQALTVAPARFDLGPVVAGNTYTLPLHVSASTTAVSVQGCQTNRTVHIEENSTTRIELAMTIPEYAAAGNGSCTVRVSSYTPPFHLSVASALAYQVTKEEHHDLRMTIEIAKHEEDMEVRGVAHLSNRGNVAEEGTLSFFIDDQPTGSIEFFSYPYADVTLPFSLPQLDAGQHTLMAKIPGGKRNISLSFVTLPKGSLRAKGSLGTALECDATPTAIMLFNNTGEISGDYRADIETDTETSSLPIRSLTGTLSEIRVPLDRCADFTARISYNNVVVATNRSSLTSPLATQLTGKTVAIVTAKPLLTGTTLIAFFVLCVIALLYRRKNIT